MNCYGLTMTTRGKKLQVFLLTKGPNHSCWEICPLQLTPVMHELTNSLFILVDPLERDKRESGTIADGFFRTSKMIIYIQPV